ncbi:MAG: hypothetical protein QM599_03450 [Pseudoxanthomonas sp.]
MATPGNAGKDKRGGRRQRHPVKTEGLGEIDRKALADLLAKLAPKATDSQRSFALKIVVKGIEFCRDGVPPDHMKLTGAAQHNRRALEKFKKGKTASGQFPFNSFMQVGGKCYGLTSTGLYLLEGGDVPINAIGDSPETTEGSYGDLKGGIAHMLRKLSVLQQLAAGFKHPDPETPFNRSLTTADDLSSTTADALLNTIIHPPDHEAKLAGFVYLAIVKGLGLKASSYDLHQFDPQRVVVGANYCRLLVAAMEQSGIEPPKEKLRPTMIKGEQEARQLLTPVVTFPDGRTYSDFAMLFPDADA